MHINKVGTLTQKGMCRFFLVFVFVLAFFQAFAQTPITIEDDTKMQLLGKDALFFEDKNRSFGFEQIKQPHFSTRFRKFPAEILNLSTTSSAVWIKFDLLMRANKIFYIQIDNPDLDSVFFYYPAREGYKYLLTGKSLPLSTESIASTHCIIEIPSTISDVPQTYYLRLTSKRYVIADMSIISQNSLLNNLLRRYMIELVFFGVILFVALYNLFVFISIRDNSYLCYVIYTLLIGLNVANTRGYTTFFFHEYRDLISKYAFLTGALYLPVISLFTIYFLKVKDYSILFHRLLQFLIGISIIHIISTLLGFGGILFGALHIFLWVNLGCYLAIGLFIYSKGYKPAIYYLASWGTFAFFTYLAILAYSDIIPFTSFSKYFTPIGILSETIISALGLAYRMGAFKNETEQLQKERIKLIESQKDVLEQKVVERTKEIEEQNEALKQVQHELLSINDLLKNRTELVEEQHSKIEELNKDLEKRIEERTNELRTTLDRLTQQNQDLEQFSYIISHNIRAPIARIQGLINIFNKDNFNDDFNKEIFKHLEQATVSLDTVIKDLTLIITIRKDLNKVKEQINIEDLIDAELFFFEELIIRSEIDVRKSLEIKILSSIKGYVQNIVHNLISNAIKYKNARKKLEILIKTHKEEPYLVLTVKDNGLGIDMEKTDLYKIFGLYQRMHTHVEGKGLGLYLVKTQVDSLKGKIIVESKLNEGATFKVYLPIDS